MESLIIFLVLCMAMGIRGDSVTKYGAVGDGVTDDSQAFLKAWEAVCGGSSDSTLLIPGGVTFLLKPVEFSGPCKPSRVNVQVMGKLLAPTMSDYGTNNLDLWISFRNLDGLSVTGYGQIDGQGSEWWEAYQSRKIMDRPTAMGFYACNNLLVDRFSSINPPRNHISVSDCNGATLSNLRITAPEDSPNTDGIDIAGSTNIHVQTSYIGTGDDCVAIGDHTSQIFINRIICGPGHGISIGSLGKNGGSAQVEDIHVKYCNFNGTQNGARIKTWQGGSGYAKNISFQHIQVYGAQNPIFIDQYYCARSTCQTSDSAVKISDIVFSGFRGTSSTDVAINLSCSKTVKCTSVMLDDIQLTSASPNSQTYSSCINAQGTSTATLPSVNCLE